MVQSVTVIRLRHNMYGLACFRIMLQAQYISTHRGKQRQPVIIRLHILAFNVSHILQFFHYLHKRLIGI